MSRPSDSRSLTDTRVRPWLFFALGPLALSLACGGGGGGGTGTPAAPTTPTASLTASPATIGKGQSSTLTWQTTNATNVSIDVIGAVQPRGRQQVSPTATTTYTLTAQGTGGTRTATARVTVNTAPPPPTSAWSLVSTPTAATQIRSFTIDNVNNWYVTDRNTGVWISKDQGNSWSQINSGLTGSNGWVITWDSFHSQLLLGMAASGTALFYRSSNQGTTWRAISIPWTLSASPSYSGASIDASGNIIDGGFWAPSPGTGTWQSSDGGATTTASTFDAPVGGLWSTYYNPVTGHLLVGTEQYCTFESTDGGASFTEVFGPDSTITPGNPHCGDLNGMENDSAGNLLAAGQGGVWKASGTPGSESYTWTPVINTQGVVNSRALGHDGAGNLYWGHSANGSTPAQWQPAVFKSTDGGNTWSPFATGLPNIEAWQFLFNRLDGHLYVVLQNGTGNLGYVYRY